MRRDVISHLVIRGRLFCKDWLHLAEFTGEAAQAECLGCGSRAKVLHAQPRIPGVLMRRLMVCPRCGVVEDSPVAARVNLSLAEGGLVRLGGRLPSKRWAGALLLISKIPRDSRGIEWPADANGSPARVYKLPETLPAGPLEVAVLIVAGTSLIVVSQALIC